MNTVKTVFRLLKQEVAILLFLLLISFATNSLIPTSILQQTNHQKEQSGANTSSHVTVTTPHDFPRSFTFPQIINALRCSSFSLNSSFSVSKPFQYRSQTMKTLECKTYYYQPRLGELFFQDIMKAKLHLSVEVYSHLFFHII